MIQREIAPVVRRLFEKYPVVTVTGPRQSGKTTLCRAVFPHLEYVNLERPDTRDFARRDPLSFLERLMPAAIIDEVQRVPELLSYIQVKVDELGKNGVFVLTGSQQLEVSQAITQSLAGRTALIRLLPFSIAEARKIRSDLDIDGMLATGFYPRIYDQGLEPVQALGDYFETYIERDLRQIAEVRRLTEFERFVRLCAGRTGQLLNLQSLGADAGVSHTTARQWLSILEASYIVFLLQPFHANLGKRLTKSPKLYFYDVGLASYLIGIGRPSQVGTHPLRGQLFENLVVVEAIKHRLNQGNRPRFFFFRSRSGLEVDLLEVSGEEIRSIEIKSGQTVSSSFFTSLKRLKELLGDSVTQQILVYGGRDRYVREGISVTGVDGLAALLG